MSPLYLYAVLGAAPSEPLGAGMAGEPLRLVDCAGVLAAAGEMTHAPSVARDSLRGHDAVVRRLAAATDALLPARFGAIAADEREMCERLERASPGLREALARVAGREQMILRIFSTLGGASAELATEGADAPSGSPAGHPSRLEPGVSAVAPGPGARYLTERARAHREAAEVRELAPLRPVLDRFVAAERVERHEAPPLVASVYHLLPRGAARAYTAAVEEAAGRLPGVRVTVSGPWAAYAFAPDALG